MQMTAPDDIQFECSTSGIDRVNDKMSLSDLDEEDCAYLLKSIEMDAFSSVVSAMRAQGMLNEYKQLLLDHLKSALFISESFYKTEIRRAADNDVLCRIAETLNPSYDTYTEWGTIGNIPCASSFNEVPLYDEEDLEGLDVADQLLKLANSHNSEIQNSETAVLELIDLPKTPFVPERLRAILRETENCANERIDSVAFDESKVQSENCSASSSATTTKKSSTTVAPPGGNKRGRKPRLNTLKSPKDDTPYDGEKPEKRLNRSVSMNDDASSNVINHRNSVSKCNDRKKSATLMIPRSPAETLHSEAGNLEPKQEQCMSLDAESTSNEASSTVASSMTTTSTSNCYIPAQPSGTLSPPVAPPSSLSALSVSIPRSAVHQMRSSTRADRRKSSHSYDDQLQLQLQQQQQQSDCQVGDDEKPRKRRTKMRDNASCVCARVMPFVFEAVVPGQKVKPPRGNPDRRTAKRPSQTNAPVIFMNATASSSSTPTLCPSSSLIPNQPHHHQMTNHYNHVSTGSANISSSLSLTLPQQQQQQQQFVSGGAGVVSISTAMPSSSTSSVASGAMSCRSVPLSPNTPAPQHISRLHLITTATNQHMQTAHTNSTINSASPGLLIKRSRTSSMSNAIALDVQQHQYPMSSSSDTNTILYARSLSSSKAQQLNSPRNNSGYMRSTSHNSASTQQSSAKYFVTSSPSSTLNTSQQQQQSNLSAAAYSNPARPYYGNPSAAAVMGTAAGGGLGVGLRLSHPKSESLTISSSSSVGNIVATRSSSANVAIPGINSGVISLSGAGISLSGVDKHIMTGGDGGGHDYGCSQELGTVAMSVDNTTEKAHKTLRRQSFSSLPSSSSSISTSSVCSASSKPVSPSNYGSFGLGSAISTSAGSATNSGSLSSLSVAPQPQCSTANLLNGFDIQTVSSVNNCYPVAAISCSESDIALEIGGHQRMVTRRHLAKQQHLLSQQACSKSDDRDQVIETMESTSLSSTSSVNPVKRISDIENQRGYDKDDSGVGGGSVEMDTTNSMSEGLRLECDEVMIPEQRCIVDSASQRRQYSNLNHANGRYASVLSQRAMVIDDYSLGEADQRLALGTGHSRRLHNSSTNGSSSRIIEEQQFVNGVIYHHNLNLNETGTGTGRSHDAIGLVPTGHCIR